MNQYLRAPAAAVVALIALAAPAAAGPGEPPPPASNPPGADVHISMPDARGDVAITRYYRKHEHSLNSVDIKRVTVDVTGPADARVMTVVYYAENVFAYQPGHDYQQFTSTVWRHSDHMAGLVAATNSTVATLFTDDNPTACTGTTTTDPADNTVTVTLDATCVANLAAGDDVGLDPASRYISLKNKGLSSDSTYGTQHWFF